MPINANYEYMNAEAKFLEAKTDEEKLTALEEMMRTMPKHKSAEALRKNIRTRYKKLKQKLETEQKKKKSASKKSGIKKADMQAAIIGPTNTGKSSLLSCLTNAGPEIANYPYTTKAPTIGTLNHEGTKIQLIDMPSIDNELCDLGIVNTADTLIIVITDDAQIKEITPFLEKASSKRIIVFNKLDLLNENQKRKISARLQSKKYDFVLISCKTKENLGQLQEKIFLSFGKIRIYTKEPGKRVDKKDPIILPKGSTVKDAAEKILHGFSSQIKQTKLTGPSSKFPNQKVGLDHVLKDKDIVEFYTR
jgi:small GTP-binding protein